MKFNGFEKVQELLRDFYSLTGIKICIYDKKEEEVCFYPEKHSGFCELLRKNTAMAEKCKRCDKNAFDVCKKSRKQYTYTCHAGLLECISPVLLNNDIIGYIAIGQIKAGVPDSFIGSNELLLNEYNRLPSLPMEKISAAIRILDACTGYEYLKNLMETVQTNIDSRIAGFIKTNLSSPLSAKLLCDKFHISHNELYVIFKEAFSATPAEYIRTQRLEHACDLLKTTRLQVSEIADLCGIPDYNYFSKLFRNNLSVSPREYRKNFSLKNSVDTAFNNKKS